VAAGDDEPSHRPEEDERRAGFFRLGFVADFLSRPILVGFLNGVAIHIFLGQIGKVFGFPMESHRIIPSLIEFIGKLPQTHLPTLAVGLATIAILIASKRFLPLMIGQLGRAAKFHASCLGTLTALGRPGADQFALELREAAEDR
jgi:MFS superfamily sulfate permease-like transporter